jgi:diacylglycerol kinase family enzyme
MRDPSLGDRLRKQIGPGGLVHHVSDYGALLHAAEQFKARDIDVLVVAGGDGTNHVTIGGMLEVYRDTPLPMFALLRGGTMNTVAHSFGIPMLSPERLLSRYMQAYRRRDERPLRVAEAEVLRVAEHHGFIFGTGAAHGFIAEYSRREARSAGWAAQVLSRAVASAVVGGETIQRVAARWKGSVHFADGSAFPDRDYLAVGASSCAQIGLGFKPFFRSADNPGRFHMLGIHCTPGELIRRLPRIWQGKSLGVAYSYERVTDHARLESRSGTVAYTLDGDVYQHEGPLEVSTGPRLRLLLPS